MTKQELNKVCEILDEYGTDYIKIGDKLSGYCVVFDGDIYFTYADTIAELL